MNELEILKSISSNVMSAMESNNKLLINNIVMTLLDKYIWNKEDIEKAKIILYISNSLYNNSDLEILPLDDGIYDLLLENTRKYVPDVQSGAMPLNIKRSNDIFEAAPQKEMQEVIYHVSEEDQNKLSNMMFPDIINTRKLFGHNAIFPTTPLEDDGYITKRQKNTKHEHPELVGTLKKCKFVTCKEAEGKGVLNNSNVDVLERDWFAPLIGNVFNPNQTLDMILSLKYDGISIEADVSTEVISARTRGDTDVSLASDLTPIFKGYKFPNAVDIGETIGMKFEAVITYPNLEIINRLKNYQYANGRTAIIGLLGGSDAYKYREYITLIPLQTTLKDDDGKPLDRLVEVEFMNKYYTRDQLFKYQVISGNYVDLLYQIKRYTEEAEFARPYIPFMYDGIVAEFYDRDIRETLGRKDSIDQYKMAVKFNPIKRKSIFRGFKYTVGQSGKITPMLYFDPVEFLGAIHDHTTGYSYEHFNELNLYIGDMIDIDYNNDVMPYVSKPDIQYNRNNHMRPPSQEEKFPTDCPYCGSSIVISNSNKSAYCPNKLCSGRQYKRVVSMVDKLGIKDIAEERITTLGTTSLIDLYNYDQEKMKSLIGEVNAYKFRMQLESLKNNPTPDYILIGSLGFTGLSAKSWRLIFESMYLSDLYNLLETGQTTDLYHLLSNIKGIGKASIDVIIDEFQCFKDDMKFIIDNFNIVNSYGQLNTRPKICFTGFRDKQLAEVLTIMGYDADDNAGLTKDTYALLVPYNGYNTGKKVEKAMKYGVKIIPVDQFRASLNIQ